MLAPDRDSGERTAWNTVSAWLANVAALVVGFFLTRFLLDHLGERLYGLYSLGGSVAAWSAVAGGPIGTYVSQFGTEHLERGETSALNRTFATSLGLSLIAALILPLPVLAFAAWPQALLRVPDDLVGPSRTAILIIGLASVVTVVVRVWEAPVFMSRRIYLKNFADMASRILGAALLVGWFLWFGPSLTFWLLVTAGLPLVLSLGFVVPAAARGLPIQLGSVAFDRTELRRATPFIAFLLVQSVATLLFDNTDALVISAMRELGVAQIAAYDVGTRWQRLVRPFVDAFVLALSPGLVALAARGDTRGLRENVTAHTRYVLLLGMVPTVGLSCIARPFVAHWVGEQFVARSVPVMWVALASALLWGPGPYAARVLVAVSRLRFATIGGITAGLLNLALSVFFVRALGLGLVGVAAGTLVSVILWCDIALALELCRVVGLRPITYLREVWLRPALALPVMLLVGAGLVRAWPPQSLLETVVQFGVSGAAMTGVAFGIGLTRREKVAVTSWATVRIGRLRRSSLSR
jgi:O-antigen/teichoic acid export membrane protein